MCFLLTGFALVVWVVDKHNRGGAVQSFGVEEEVPGYEVGSPLRRLNVGRCSASVVEVFAGKRKGGRIRG